LTVNLVLLFPDDFIEPDRVRLTGRRCRHVREVHRAQPGKQLRVGLLDGLMGTGVVQALDESLLELQVILDSPPPPPSEVRLVLAVPRPKVLNRVMAMAASLGVKHLHLLNSWRVERSYWKSPKMAEENLREQCILGLEQACDTVLPQILQHRFFREFCEQVVPRLAQHSHLIVGHPGPDASLPEPLPGPVTLFIGPEGGFIESEIKSLKAAGARLVSLGPRILRVETAIPTLMARLTQG
jgi:RsmE family RNA methyltransferase